MERDRTQDGLDDDDTLRQLAATNPVAPGDLDEAAGDRIWGAVSTRNASRSAPRLRVGRLAWTGLAGSAIAALLVAVSFARLNSPPQPGPVVASGISSPVAVATTGQSSVPSDAHGTGAGGGIASCVVVYSIDQLKSNKAAIAFDGVVSEIGPTWVDYSVREWFRGPGGDSVRLGSAVGFGRVSETNGLPNELAPAAPGQRYLVVAVDGNVWGCGFTHEYSEGMASEWRQALAG